MKFTLPKDAISIMNKLKKTGFQAFAVGGCVRDSLLNRKTNDWDFTTDATPEQILKLFPDGFYDNKFGTVGVPVKPTNIYEITTFRSESGYSDHRHPDKIVWGETIQDDLKRRDFTINAMALRLTTLPQGKRSYELIDPFNGQEDLKNKIIKAVGDPDKRFQEDALRMMRAIRIATQLQFLIENKTFSALKNNAGLLHNISQERIRDELLKILSSSYPADGIILLRNGGLMNIILPELEKCFGVEQKSPQRHHIYDVGTHLLYALKNCPSEDPIVRLATLLHDVGKPVTVAKTSEGVITFYNHEIIGASIVRKIADRLHLSKNDKEKLLRLVRFHQFTVDERQTDSALRRFIRNVGKEYLDDILALRTGDRLGGGARETSWRLDLFKKRLVEVQKQPFTVADLKVSGHDVMKIYNIVPGPIVGTVLNKLFADVEKGILKNEREILLEKIKEFKKGQNVN